MRRSPLESVVAPLSLALLAGSASGQVQQFADWQPISGNNWTTLANWNSPIAGTFPDNTLADTYAVNISGPICVMNTSPTIDKIDVQTGGLLRFPNNQTLTIISAPLPIMGGPASGTFGINGGTVEMNSIGNNTDLRFVGGAGTEAAIGGGNAGGRLEMSDNTQNRIFSDGGRLVLNAGLTIEGAGQIGLDVTEIHLNDTSVIRANLPSEMILDPNGAGFLNNAFLIAENGGTMTLRAGPFTNNGVIIPNTPDATVKLDGADITGGQVGGGTGLFQLDGGSVSGTTLVIGGGAGQGGTGLVSADTTIGDLTVNQNASLDMNNNVSGLRGSGMWNNMGVIRMNSIGNNTDIVLNADITLVGAGTIDTSPASSNRFYGATGAERLNNVNNTIRGGGQLGTNQMRLTNTGTIDADQPGATLEVNLTGHDSINLGTMQASNQGILELVSDTIDMSGGGGARLVQALNDSVVRLEAVRLIGGTLNTEGTGQIVIVGGAARVDGVTNTGLIRLPNNTTLSTAGQILNNGTIAQESIGNNTDLLAVENTTYNGGGRIRMVNQDTNRIRPGNDGVTIVSGTMHAITGTGNWGVNTGTLVNNGLVSADEGTDTLAVDPGISATNNGVMEATGSARLELRSGPFDNTFGMVQGVDDAEVRLTGSCEVTGGDVFVVDTARLRMSGGSILGTMPFVGPTADALIDASGGGWDDGFTNQGVINISNNVSFDVGFLGVNNGVIEMNSIGNTTAFTLVSDLILTGGGEVRMNTSTANRWFSSGGTFRLTNENNTIRGVGQIGNNAMTLTNQGLIEADDPANTLNIDLAGDNSFNDGVYQASNGATLTLRTDSHDQSGGGTIRALDGSTVSYQNAVNIIGGTLESVGTGTHSIQSGTALFTNVTNDGLVFIDNNLRLDLNDSFINNGTVRLRTVGNNTDLVATNDTTISGTGEIVMGDIASNCRIRPVNADTTLTIEGNTIRGRGNIGANTGTVINRGTIDADNVASLDIDPGVLFRNEAGGLLTCSNTGTLRILAGEFENDGGTIEVPGGRVITRTGQLDQNGGLVRVNGLLDIIGANFQQRGGDTVIDGLLRTEEGRGVISVGGTLRGSGLVDGLLNLSAGSVRPGGAPTEGFVDDLSFTGDVFLFTNGRFEPSVVNDSLSTSLFAGGEANLGGTLDVQFDGFVPALGERFVVLTAGAGINGTFETVTATGLPVGLTVGAFYFPDRVEIAARCSADVNGDGLVTPADFTAWLAFFGDPGLPGSERADVNGDGLISPADFTAWLAAFSAPCP